MPKVSWKRWLRFSGRVTPKIIRLVTSQRPSRNALKSPVLLVSHILPFLVTWAVQLSQASISRSPPSPPSLATPDSTTSTTSPQARPSPLTPTHNSDQRLLLFNCTAFHRHPYRLVHVHDIAASVPFSRGVGCLALATRAHAIPRIRP